MTAALELQECHKFVKMIQRAASAWLESFIKCFPQKTLLISSVIFSEKKKKKDLRHLIHVCLHTIVSVELKGLRHILDCDSCDFLHLSGMWVSLAISSIISTTITLTTSHSPSSHLFISIFLSLSPLIRLHFCSSHPVPCNLSSFKAS